VTNGSNPETAGGSHGQVRPAAGDDALPGATGTGENLCPECNGSGTLENKPCQTCDGTGKVIEGIGGG
jgi:DnaJ-class molecular chaperone